MIEKNSQVYFSSHYTHFDFLISPQVGKMASIRANEHTAIRSSE